MKLRFIYFLLGLSLFFNHTIAQPTVSSATYNVTTGTLSVTGSNFEAIAGGSDIDASKISLFGQGNTGYFLTTDNSVERTDAERFSIILTGTQKTAVDNILNRNGSSAWDGNNFRIEFAASWNSASSSATSAFISVEGVLSPQITSAEFNFGNGNLVITGTNLKNIDGANNDIDVTRLTISNGTVSYTLTSATPSVDVVSNQATLVVQGADKSMLNYILNRDGTAAESGLPFAITASAGWNSLGESDPGPNTLTVTSYLKPQVSSVAYDASTGIFTVTGSYMASITGSSNDIDASKLQITGYQGVTYSLSSAFSVDLINETSFKIYLSGADRTQVEVLLNKNGTSAWGGVSYNLQLNDGWNSGILGSADITNAITVSGASNQPPKVSNVNLGGDLINGKVLSLSFDYFDLEEDPAGSHIIKWYTYTDNLGAGKTLITDVTGTSYTLRAQDIGLFINVEITPVAQTGTLTGTMVSSPVRGPVLNAPPSAGTTSITGSPYKGQVLTGKYEYDDPEDDTEGASTFQWYRSDNPTGALTPISTSLTYELTSDDVNKYIFFEVVPVATTGTSPGIASRSAALEVLNAAPSAGTATIEGSPYKEQTLTGKYNYTDLENDAESGSTFQWYRSNSPEGVESPISGATQTTYKLTDDDLNMYISFEVTPMAIKGTNPGATVRSEKVKVLNGAPEAQAPSVTGSRYLKQTITASYIYFDLEGDTEGATSVQWYQSDNINGPDEAITGATDKNFLITDLYLNKYLSFEVTPQSVSGTTPGVTVRSSRFAVLNQAPSASQVSIKGSFRIGQVLQGEYIYSDLENDAEATSAYNWYRANNSAGSGKTQIIGANTKNYVVQSTDMNKYISFEVIPVASAGSLIGNAIASPHMGPVVNSAPLATNVRITGTQSVCKTLHGEYDYEDLEGDQQGATAFRWLRTSTVDGTKTPIDGAIEQDYTLTTADQGKFIFFEVTPRAISGSTTGTATLSNPTGSIVNLLPTLTILGTASVCSGSSTELTMSFTGTPPWNLTYTDGTETHQLVSAENIYHLNVLKAGTYKGVTLVDNTNCMVTYLPSTATISIQSLPEVNIAGVNSAYNLRSNPVKLTGNPTGGTFYGPGVIPSTSMFYPSIAGTQNSPHTIIYEYRSPQTGCSNRDTIMIEVVDADASISGLRTGGKYCNFDTPFVITGTNAIGSVGSFAITGGVGLKDNNNNTATINPSDLSAGNYTISYSYFDGIQLTIYKDISIEILDEARIFGITGTTYCSNSAPMEIYSNYIGGTFSGNAVFKNSQTNKYYFNPALDVSGNTMVTFTYATSYGCVVSKSVDKFIAPVPTAEFSVINNCYNGDSTAFKNKTISDITISKWDWRFGDSQSSEANNRSASFEPKHKYPSIGNRNVRLIAENIYGCKDTVDKIIHLGDIPAADFGWYSECFVKGYPVSFKNKSTNIDEITKYKWVVEDTSKLDFNYSIKDILHTFPVIRDYTVNFKVTTEYGCSDSVKKVIRLRPIFYLRDTFYSNNFEVGKGYWLPADSLMVNNWKFGTPNGTKINTAASGSKAYYTSLKDTRKNQQLIITSPCFNLKGMNRPFISLETYSDVAKGTEGTVLQYSEDNGISWQNVGGFNTGINWYNDFAIQSQPGGQQIGWSDKFTGWINARHNLDQIKTDSMIRFRVVFGQNSKATGNDGFAFDNVLIANRIKKVLFEHFTNNSQVVSLKANLYLDSVVALNNEDAVAIQYHTSFPGIDTFNMHNSSDPGSRVLYYGIGITPNAYLEGGTESRYIYDFNNKMPNTADIKNLSMKDVSFKLDLKVDKSSSKVSGILGIAALKKLTGRTISARIIVVEDIVSQIAGGQITYRNVVRKILPSAGGTVLSSSWDMGKKESVNFSWDYRNVYNPAKVHIVAFLQDELTRDIYQVVSDDTSKVNDNPGVGIKISEHNVEVNVYPNPAKDLLVVEFSEIPNNDQRIEIWSTNGKMVLSEKLFKGVSRFEADVQNFNNGLYFVRILDKTRVLATKKLVIMH